MGWHTYIAVGDSFTEGLQDGPRPDGSFLGWADRVAWALAERDRHLRYANLAVRGKLLDEVVADQLVGAIARSPDLLSFHAGGNDVLRPGTDLAGVLRRYDLAVRRATADVPDVVLFTVLERSGRGGGRAAQRLADRIARFNDGVRHTAERTGALLVDIGTEAALQDRRMWHEDRLHLRPAGHERVAAAVLERLDVRADDGRPAGWWREPLPPPAPATPGARVADDARWVAQHLLPWVGRRLRGVSSGDGRTGKRPRPARP